MSSVTWGNLVYNRLNPCRQWLSWKPSFCKYCDILDFEYFGFHTCLRFHLISLAFQKGTNIDIQESAAGRLFALQPKDALGPPQFQCNCALLVSRGPLLVGSKPPHSTLTSR